MIVTSRATLAHNMRDERMRDILLTGPFGSTRLPCHAGCELQGSQTRSTARAATGASLFTVQASIKEKLHLCRLGY